MSCHFVFVFTEEAKESLKKRKSQRQTEATIDSDTSPNQSPVTSPTAQQQQQPLKPQPGQQDNNTTHTPVVPPNPQLMAAQGQVLNQLQQELLNKQVKKQQQQQQQPQAQPPQKAQPQQAQQPHLMVQLKHVPPTSPLPPLPAAQATLQTAPASTAVEATTAQATVQVAMQATVQATVQEATVHPIKPPSPVSVAETQSEESIAHTLSASLSNPTSETYLDTEPEAKPSEVVVIQEALEPAVAEPNSPQTIIDETQVVQDEKELLPIEDESNGAQVAEEEDNAPQAEFEDFPPAPPETAPPVDSLPPPPIDMPLPQAPPQVVQLDNLLNRLAEIGGATIKKQTPLSFDDEFDELLSKIAQIK